MTANPLLALPVLRAGPPLRIARAATVLLHGRGRAPAEMLEFAARLDLPEMAFAALGAAGGTWYPESFLAPRERNEPHLGWALARVESAVREIERAGIPRDRIALAGFSQGACLAAEYVFRTPTRWGALAAVIGGLIGPPGSAWTRAGDLGGTPVLLATSDVDEWVPLERVKETAVVFAEMRGEVDLRVHPGRSHAIEDEDVRATRALLSMLVRG